MRTDVGMVMTKREREDIKVNVNIRAVVIRFGVLYVHTEQATTRGVWEHALQQLFTIQML